MYVLVTVCDVFLNHRLIKTFDALPAKALMLAQQPSAYLVKVNNLSSSKYVSFLFLQVYKGLDIITNKVTKEELNTCPHHVIDYVNPLHSKYTVTDFRDKALPIVSLTTYFLTNI